MPKIGEVGPQLDIGAYAVRVRSIEEEESKDKPGESYYRWTFVTAEGVTFKPTSSLNLGPKSKAYKWCRAILASDPKGMDFPDDILGKPALLDVDHDEDGYAYVADVHPRLPVLPKATPPPEPKDTLDEPVSF